MNATSENNATLEAARRDVIDSLTRSGREGEAETEFKELDETSIRRPTFRPVRLLLVV